ncbi:MAG TPA: UDP-N-acetylmuramoyl-L-alanyl-D-glutamate--2,6-diaminopimelate ligase [Candidatus Acidoferrales bacterium]|jgi:UDP-N-acetylmuramoyl-L-alanyl-D-glutamate--2,6-diaminopimelate ligase|nr:UDP-N-acetylmuramoyl-L-alanyl-D-glutamate--2,6-diaminopimelate ligase [Candidatus Acidoferrales bacterium]
MKLKELFAGAEVGTISGPAAAENGSLEIEGLAYDSRKATAGSVFFALHGEKLDGTKFVEDAVKRGAIAVAGDGGRPAALAKSVGWIELLPGSARRGLARAAANFYGHPADALKLVGVTGTNGKTTTAFLVDSIVRAAGFTDGLIGTTGYRTPKGFLPAPNTTPESLDLQQIFAETREARGTHVVLEASSHALAMERLWGCHFAAAIFTNLTRDHLDYHKTFEEYFAAKKLLFAGTGAGAPDAGVINIDDPYGAQLAELARRTLTYGLKNAADLSAKKFSPSFEGLEFTAQTPAGNIEVRSPLVGRINVYNILAAIGAGIALEIPNAKIEQGIANLALVPGRFQRVDEGQPFLVVVDYAHTDDALRNLIATARELSASGRIITVFGAGGERDRTKRPLMGEAAGSLSDLVVLTSDNPRSEDPLRIINDVVVGLQKVDAKYRVEPDRERALEMAIEEARSGDIVLLAGKGHETYQVLRNGTIEFDDREKARAILRQKGFVKQANGRESRN